jgi:hypothetical protein
VSTQGDKNVSLSKAEALVETTAGGEPLAFVRQEVKPVPDYHQRICPACGQDAVKAARAFGACASLSVWWDQAKPVIQSGEAAHDLAGIVMVARAALGLLTKKPGSSGSE